MLATWRDSPPPGGRTRLASRSRHRFAAVLLLTVLLAAIASRPETRADSLAGGSGLPAPPALLSHPPGFFHLAYCGSGRKNDPAGKLHSFDWNAAAEGF